MTIYQLFPTIAIIGANDDSRRSFASKTEAILKLKMKLNSYNFRVDILPQYDTPWVPVIWVNQILGDSLYSCLLRSVELCPVNTPAQEVCTQKFLHISSPESHGGYRRNIWGLFQFSYLKWCKNTKYHEIYSHESRNVLHASQAHTWAGLIYMGQMHMLCYSLAIIAWKAGSMLQEVRQLSKLEM